MSGEEVQAEKQEPSFKHLGILRKALSKAHTGEIVYQTVGEEEGQISVTVGDLLNDETTVEALKQLLTDSIVGCDLITERVDENLQKLAPPAVMTKVLNEIHWEPETLQQLKKTFAKLPPIDVKMVPMHRYGYNDGLTYLTLYQDSLKDEQFTTVKFFNDRPSYTTLEQQIKVLVLGYCLGLINPKSSKSEGKKGKKKEGQKSNRRLSMANRILNKIRGM